MQVTAKSGNQLTLQNPPVDAGAGAACPVGSIQMFAGTVAPSGWLMCDGTAYSRTTYVGLFQVAGTTYGAGDGTSTFNVPNMGGAFPLGPSGTTYALGATGGEAAHVLTVAELAAHNHTISISDPTHTHTMGNHYHYCAGVDHLHGMDHCHNMDHYHNWNAQGSHTHGLSDPTHAHNYTQWSAGNIVTSGASYIGLNSGGANHPVNAGGTGCSIAAAATPAGNTVYASQTSSGWVNTYYASQTNSGWTNTGASDRSLAFNSGGPSTNTDDAAGTGISASEANTGSGTAHNNMPPYVVVNYIIKY
jgi:microcystin-dependent protein